MKVGKSYNNIFADNATLFGEPVSFNNFLLRRTTDGWEVIGYQTKTPSFLLFPNFVTSIGNQAEESYMPKNAELIRDFNCAAKVSRY